MEPRNNIQSTSVASLQFQQYGYRIVITILYAAASIINGMCWVVVTPIAVPLQNQYHISSTWMAFIPMSYMIFFVFINFPSNWVIDVKGIKNGVVLGAFLTFVGCTIRCFVNVHFAFVIIGQVICAIAQPFLLNAPMKIASRWYMPKNRSLAMAILSVANIIGTAVGFVIPSLFVSDTDQNIKEHFFQLLLVEGIISAAVAILIIVFFKESPPTLPSLSSMTQAIDFKESIGMLLKDKKFMSLALSFGTVNGTFNIYGSLMDDILDPYGFTPDQVSTFGAGLMISGIISAGLFGAYVEKTLKYRRTFLICGSIGLVTTFAFPLALKFLTDSLKYYWIYMILVLLQGIVFIPLQPLTIDYGSDTMFPIGQAQITGFMLSMGQIFGVGFVEAAQLIFGLGDDDKSMDEQKTAAFNSVVFCNAFLIVGCVILMLQNGQLKRAKLDYERKQENESLIDPSSIVTSVT